MYQIIWLWPEKNAHVVCFTEENLNTSHECFSWDLLCPWELDVEGKKYPTKLFFYWKGHTEMKEVAQEFQVLCNCNLISLLDCARLSTWLIDCTFTLNELFIVYFSWKLQCGESYMWKNFEILRCDRYKKYHYWQIKSLIAGHHDLCRFSG